MKQRINTTLFIGLISIIALGCQNQPDKNVVVSTPDNKSQAVTDSFNQKKYLKTGCKNTSSPLIKDKSKIKEMLFNEGKIDNSMSEDEINIYIDNYIKKKSSIPCKPISKKSAYFPILENNYA